MCPRTPRTGIVDSLCTSRIPCSRLGWLGWPLGLAVVIPHIQACFPSCQLLAAQPRGYPRRPLTSISLPPSPLPNQGSTSECSEHKLFSLPQARGVSRCCSLQPGCRRAAQPSPPVPCTGRQPARQGPLCSGKKWPRASCSTLTYGDSPRAPCTTKPPPALPSSQHPSSILLGTAKLHQGKQSSFRGLIQSLVSEGRRQALGARSCPGL